MKNYTDSSAPTPPPSPSAGSTASASPQHGSPDSDKFFPGPYHPPSPTPESSYPQSDSDSESLLTSLQKHIEDWASARGGVQVRHEYFVFGNKNSALPARLPAMPSLLETQEEDSQLPSGQGDAASLEASQPEDSQIPSGQPDGESGADENDGWIRFGFIRAVKTVVHHLLSAAINKYMRDNCYGCINDRPSQRDHECFEQLEDGFFESNYYRVMPVLCNARFIGAIQQFLAARNIHQDNDTVNAVAQAYLYELTLVKQVHDPIDEVCGQVVQESSEFRDQLEAALQYWRGC